MKARASYNNISMLQNTCINKKNHSTAIKLEEQLQNTGPLLKVYIREWLAGSAVVLVL